MNLFMPGYAVEARAVKEQSAFTKLDFLKTKFFIRLLVLGVFIVSLSLFYIWSRVQIVQMGYEINEHKKEQQKLLEQNKMIKMELSLMKSPSRIEKYAQENLKMQMPDQRQIIEIH